MKRRQNIVETLREAIKDSDLNITQLADLSKVDKGQISRFVNGERTLTLESAEKIAKALKWELKPITKKVM